MTIEKGYKAMDEFLDDYYKETSSDDLGSLLGGMLMTDEEETMDPAAWQDWNKSTKKISNSSNLSNEEVYKAMYDYMNDYRLRIRSEEISEFLRYLDIKDGIINRESIAWKKWILILRQIIN